MFETEASCLATCASSFDCVRVEGQRQYSWIGLVPSGPRASVGYCLPSFPIGNRSRPAVPGKRTATFSTLSGCEEECIIVDDGRDWACHDWVFIIKFTLFTWLFSSTAGFFAAKNHVATRQKFSVAMKGCFCYEVLCRCCGAIPIPSLHCFGECSNGHFGCALPTLTRPLLQTVMVCCPLAHCFRVLNVVFSQRFCPSRPGSRCTTGSCCSCCGFLVTLACFCFG